MPYAQAHWILFPAADNQEKPYPRPLKRAGKQVSTGSWNADVKLGLEPVYTNAYTDINSTAVRILDRDLSPTWWENSNRRTRRSGSNHFGPSAKRASRPRTQECTHGFHAPGTALAPIARKASSRLANQAYCKRTTETDEYDSDSTVVRAGTRASTNIGSPGNHAPSHIHTDTSDKENEPPHKPSQFRGDSVIPHKHYVKHGSRIVTPSSEETSHSFSRLARIRSHGLHEDLLPNDSPATSPRVFLHRHVPSDAYITSPLKPTHNATNDTISNFDVHSQAWTKLTLGNENVLVSQCTLLLDLKLPRKRWLTETVLIPFTVTRGPWPDSELVMHVQESAAQLPTAEAPLLTNTLGTQVVFTVSKKELASILTVRFSIIHPIKARSMTIDLPKFQPISGQLLTESFYVQDPEAPLAFAAIAGDSKSAHRPRWSPLVIDTGCYWHAESHMADGSDFTLEYFGVNYLAPLTFRALEDTPADIRLAWDFALHIEEAALHKFQCHMRVKIQSTGFWEQPSLIIDSGNWSMSYCIMNGILLTSKSNFWFIDPDGTFVLRIPTNGANHDYINLDLSWGLPLNNLESTTQGLRVMVLPVISSHQILSGSVTTPLPGATLNVRCSHSNMNVLLGASGSNLPTLEPSSVLTFKYLASADSHRHNFAREICVRQDLGYDAERAFLEKSLRLTSESKKSNSPNRLHVTTFEATAKDRPPANAHAQGSQWFPRYWMGTFVLILLGSVLISHLYKDDAPRKFLQDEQGLGEQVLESAEEIKDPHLNTSEIQNGAPPGIRDTIDEFLRWAWLAW